MLCNLQTIRDQIWSVQSRIKCQSDLIWLETILFDIMSHLNNAIREVTDIKHGDYKQVQENSRLKDEICIMEDVMKKQENEIDMLQQAMMCPQKVGKIQCDPSEGLKKNISCLRQELTAKKDEIKCLKRTINQQLSSACHTCCQPKVKSHRAKENEDAFLASTPGCYKFKEIILRKDKEIKCLKDLVESERMSALTTADCYDNLKKKYCEMSAHGDKKSSFDCNQSRSKDMQNRCLMEEKERKIMTLEKEITILRCKNEQLCRAESNDRNGFGMSESRFETRCKGINSNNDNDVSKLLFKIDDMEEKHRKSMELAKQHQDEVVETLLDKINDSKGELERKDRELSQSFVCQKKLEQAAERSKSEVERQKSYFEKQLSDLERNIQSHEDEACRLNQKNSELAEKLSSSKSKLFEMSVELNTATDRLSSSDHRMCTLSTDVDQLKGLLKQSAISVAERERDAKIARQELNREKLKVANLEAELRLHKENSCTKCDEMEDMRDWLSKCEQEVNSVQQRLNLRNQETSRLNSSLNAKKAEIEGVRRKLGEISQEAAGGSFISPIFSSTSSADESPIVSPAPGMRSNQRSNSMHPRNSSPIRNGSKQTKISFNDYMNKSKYQDKVPLEVCTAYCNTMDDQNPNQFSTKFSKDISYLNDINDLTNISNSKIQSNEFSHSKNLDRRTHSAENYIDPDSKMNIYNSKISNAIASIRKSPKGSRNPSKTSKKLIHKKNTFNNNLNSRQISQTIAKDFEQRGQIPISLYIIQDSNAPSFSGNNVQCFCVSKRDDLKCLGMQSTLEQESPSDSSETIDRVITAGYQQTQAEGLKDVTSQYESSNFKQLKPSDSMPEQVPTSKQKFQKSSSSKFQEERENNSQDEFVSKLSEAKQSQFQQDLILQETNMPLGQIKSCLCKKLAGTKPSHSAAVIESPTFEAKSKSSQGSKGNN